MKCTYVLSILILVLAISCKGKNGKAKKANDDTARRFPLIDLLKEDFNDVYKTPYFMYKVNVDLKTGKQLDSVFISRDDFKKIVDPILKADVTSDDAKEIYEETSYHDLSLKSISVYVNATDPDVELQNIVANFDDEKNKLRTATITLENKVDDTLITQKVFWKINSNLTIATQKKLKDSILSEIKTFVHWNVRQLQQ